MPPPDGQVAFRPETLADLDWTVDHGDDEIPLLTNGDNGPHVMPRGDVCVFAAPGETGKTQAVLQLALAIASGTNWLGHYTPRSAGRVLLVVAEERPRQIRRRMRTAHHALGLARHAATIGRNVEVQSLRGAVAHLVDRGEWTDLHREIVEYLEKQPPFDLVVLDPLARFYSGEENDNGAASAFIAACEALTKGPGEPTVLVTHHSAKQDREIAFMDSDKRLVMPSGTGARGAGAFTDNARWAARLAPFGTWVTPDGKREKDSVAVPDRSKVCFAATKYNASAGGKDPILLHRVGGGVLLTPEQIEKRRKLAAGIPIETPGSLGLTGDRNSQVSQPSGPQISADWTE